MRLEVSDCVKPAEWDAGIVDVGGTIFHSSGWAQYIVRAQPNTAPRFFRLLSDGGERVGAALGFQARSSHALMAPFTGRLWFDAIPVVLGNDPGKLKEFLQLIEAHARQDGNTELDVGSFGWPGGPAGLDQLGFDLTRYWEFVIDLGQSEEDLWEHFEYKRRKNIKKAGRCGVAIKDLFTREGIAALRVLQGASSDRIVLRGGPDIRYKGDPGQDAVMVLLESELARIVGAEVDGEVVSAGLFTFFNGLVYHTLSGHGRKALETQAPTLLLWETIKRYRGEGARRFNQGGCSIDAVNEDSPEHGVYEYKKAFGGACIECTSGRKILRPTTHKVITLLKSIGR
jgi:hypothetical protein